MSCHRYPLPALLADYVRAGAGVLLTGVPLALMQLPVQAAAILATLAALFALFAAATFKRQLDRVELDEQGILIRGLRPARLPWSALERLTLRWFGRRRHPAGGHLQLVLRGAGQRLSIDSRIEDFTAIVVAAAAAARRRSLTLSEVTSANLTACGVGGESYGTRR